MRAAAQVILPIDAEWIEEHARQARRPPPTPPSPTPRQFQAPRRHDRPTPTPPPPQVSRLLPGGVAIVGLYAFCSEGSFKASLPALQRAAAALPAAVQSGGEALVLHADSTSRNKFAAKRRAAALRPKQPPGALPPHLSRAPCPLPAPRA